jgi:hypothetical protein
MVMKMIGTNNRVIVDAGDRHITRMFFQMRALSCTNQRNLRLSGNIGFGIVEKKK